MPAFPPTLALDAEFLFLLSLLRPLFAGLAPEHRPQARLWLQRLCHFPARAERARRDRNEYLSRLYSGMLDNKLDDVFLDEPPEGALRPAEDVFPDVDLTSWLDQTEGDVVDGREAAHGRGDADERAYLATQVLPGGRGAFGYLAVSLAKGGPHWTPGSPNTSSWKPGQPQFTSTPLLPSPTHQKKPQEPKTDSAKFGRAADLLGSRPSAGQRQQLVSFYDSLIKDLDQAIVEPEKASADLEKLVSSFKDSSITAGSDLDVSDRQRELLSQLRGRLEERRDRAVERSVLLDSLEKEECTAQPRPQPRRDEDDVWNIKPDNVALLEAAYPSPLVQRFLDAIVRERVAVLGRLRARRYCQRHVEGLEDDAAEDLEHYRDATAAWAGVLRAAQESGLASVPDAAALADKSADIAGKATDAIRELGAARALYFQREEQMREAQNYLQAQIEVLRAEEAQLKRRGETSE